MSLAFAEGVLSATAWFGILLAPWLMARACRGPIAGVVRTRLAGWAVAAVAATLGSVMPLGVLSQAQAVVDGALSSRGCL